MLRANFALVV